MVSNGNGKSSSRLSPKERNDIKCAAEYAHVKANDMEDLKNKFEKMGKFRLFWDGKVPEEEKTFLKRVSLSCSDKEAAIDNIQEYLDFFKEVETGMKKLIGEMEKSENEESDPLSIVHYLRDLLSDMDKNAKSDLLTTGSSSFYRKHGEFIEKFSQLNGMLNRAECIFSREKIRDMETDLEKCRQTVLKFQNDVKDFKIVKEGLEKQIEVLADEKERQRRHEQALVSMNAKLRQDQEALVSINAKLRQDQEALVSMNAKLRLDQEDLMNQYSGVCGRLESIERYLNLNANRTD